MAYSYPSKKMAWPKYFLKAISIRAPRGARNSVIKDRRHEGNTFLMRCELGPVEGLMSFLFEVAN